MNANKNIWFFREPRSGSMWTLYALHKALNKRQAVFDGILQSNVNGIKAGHNENNLVDAFLKTKHQFCNNNDIYSSHYFFLLPHIETTEEIFLLRSTRRNSLDQILSLLYMDMNKNGFLHYYVDSNKNLSYNHFLRTLENPVMVSKQQVLKKYETLKTMNKLWDENAKRFSNFTIYYEDLNDGVEISDLNIKIAFDMYTDYMNKTPEYKSKAFANYEQILDWYKEFEDKYGPIKE
jgi:hypothetical protein